MPRPSRENLLEAQKELKRLAADLSDRGHRAVPFDKEGQPITIEIKPIGSGPATGYRSDPEPHPNYWRVKWLRNVLPRNLQPDRVASSAPSWIRATVKALKWVEDELRDRANPPTLTLSLKNAEMVFGDTRLGRVGRISKDKPGEWALLRAMMAIGQGDWVDLARFSKIVDGFVDQIETKRRKPEPYAKLDDKKRRVRLMAICRRATGSEGREWRDRWIEWPRSPDGILVRDFPDGFDRV